MRTVRIYNGSYDNDAYILIHIIRELPFVGILTEEVYYQDDGLDIVIFLLVWGFITREEACHLQDLILESGLAYSENHLVDEIEPFDFTWEYVVSAQTRLPILKQMSQAVKAGRLDIELN